MFRAPSVFVKRLALASGVVSVLLACTASPEAKADRLCTPGAYVFCRCRDRQEGSKLCSDDGAGFGPCEPCESFDNPEGPLEPGDPDGSFFPDEDAGVEAGGEQPASCGNGVVDPGEDCDDKNTNETDGCDSKCKLAGTTPAASNACPGLTVHVWGGAQKPSLITTTTGSGNRSVTPNCTGGPNPTSGASAPDRVFKVIAHKTGTMTVTTTDADYNSFLYVSDACAPSANTWLECVNDSAAAAGESMSFPVESGKTYYVFVDGAGIGTASTPPNKEGTARVTFAIP